MYRVPKTDTPSDMGIVAEVMLRTDAFAEGTPMDLAAQTCFSVAFRGLS
ncbi:MAG: hypothetical protein AAGU16_02250 [Desulfitobacterium hafniense]